MSKITEALWDISVVVFSIGLPITLFIEIKKFYFIYRLIRPLVNLFMSWWIFVIFYLVSFYISMTTLYLMTYFGLKDFFYFWSLSPEEFYVSPNIFYYYLLVLFFFVWHPLFRFFELGRHRTLIVEVILCFNIFMSLVFFTCLYIKFGPRPIWAVVGSDTFFISFFLFIAVVMLCNPRLDIFDVLRTYALLIIISLSICIVWLII